jgi:hypothetical protein
MSTAPILLEDLDAILYVPACQEDDIPVVMLDGMFASENEVDVVLDGKSDLS